MDQDPQTAETENAVPEAAVEAFDEGSRAYLADDNAAAVEQLSKAATAGELPEAYYLLGLAQLRAGDREAAVAALKRAAETTHNVMLRDYAQKKLARLGA